jgi:hypothetical protein
LPSAPQLSSRSGAGLGPARRLAAAAACATLFSSVPAAAPATARADGDPASDVLATQALFLPWDAGVSARRQVQLDELLATAARSGYPIRLAVVASASDLGSVTELWRQPQRYAEFLGEELSLVYRGPLLVIMPDGFGLYQQDRAGSPSRAESRGIAIRSGDGIAAAAVAAVERLASAAGHPVRLSEAKAVIDRRPRAITPWVVFFAGWAVIVLAWVVSLRARPARIGSFSVSRRRA